MITRVSIRNFSTRRLVDKLFNILQSPIQYEWQTKLGHFITTDLQQEEKAFPNLFSDIIHRWAIEQPTKQVLLTCETNNDECQKLTFNDLYGQSSRLANVLTGKEFDLEPGKTVLVILPHSSPERVLLQLACSLSGLVFCPYDPKDLSNFGISQRIQKLSVDCVITNEDNLEIARVYTHNPLRPLKKGLITKCSTSKPLPVGWIHLLQSANDAKSEFTKDIQTRSNTSVIRLLSNNNEVIQYSQKDFNTQLLIAAFWLNIDQISRLTWMKTQNEILSIAPLLFGSSIFYKETENVQTMLNTFENYPIDSFCASLNYYQMLENQQQETKTKLKQLFSNERIDSTSKARWYSLTNLNIRDNFARFDNEYMLKHFSNNLKQKTHHEEIKLSLGSPISPKSIPLKQTVSHIPVKQNQIHDKLSPI